MFPSKIVLFALIFGVAAVSSQPLHGHKARSHNGMRVARRTTCGRTRRSSSALVSATGAPAPSSFQQAQAEPTRVTSSSRPSTRPSSQEDEDEDEEPKTTTTSSKKPQETKTPSNGNSLISKLFPVDQTSRSWSTAENAENQVSLSDKTFQMTNLISSLSHDYVEHEGKKAMKAHFPKGSYTFTHSPQGGLSFYAPGPDSVDLTTAKEATLGYSVFFPDGFQFNMGGKLPGLFGGDSYGEAVGCSGGRRSDACFSARLMWRDGGHGEFYTYLPPFTDSRFAANEKQCNVKPESDCNPTYGASIGRGSFTFPTGQWATVSERVKLNDVGKANGEIELFFNGKSVVSVNGLILRARGEGKFRGIQMQTFFGGSKPVWGSPKTQDLYFADFSVAITETF